MNEAPDERQIRYLIHSHNNNTQTLFVYRQCKGTGSIAYLWLGIEYGNCAFLIVLPNGINIILV